MIKELGVFPHNMANSSPAVWEDLVFVGTSTAAPRTTTRSVTQGAELLA